MNHIITQLQIKAFGKEECFLFLQMKWPRIGNFQMMILSPQNSDVYKEIKETEGGQNDFETGILLLLYKFVVLNSIEMMFTNTSHYQP